MSESTGSLREIVLNNKKKQHLYSKQFYDVFGLRLADFMNPVTGFDIVEFDKTMDTPDWKSLEDYLNEISYEACELVRNLL